MNTSTYAPLDGILADLIRHGLPAEYARRAASELADHHRDLVDELQAAGWTDSHASPEASRRLGEPRALVKKTVREYQQRYWCGRWPLITFLLGPLPALLFIWLATGLTLAAIGWIAGQLMDETTTTAVETVGQYVVGYALKIWLMLVSPALVVTAFCWLAVRAAMSRCWTFVASGMIAIVIGFAFCKIEFKSTTNPTGRFLIGYTPWFLPDNFSPQMLGFIYRDMRQLSQFVLPLVVTAVCIMYSRSRFGDQRQLHSIAS